MSAKDDDVLTFDDDDEDMASVVSMSESISTANSQGNDGDCEVTNDGFLVPCRSILPDSPNWGRAEDFTVVFKEVSLTLLGTVRMRLDSENTSNNIDYKGLLSVEDDAISVFQGGATDFDLSGVECAVLMAHQYFSNAFPSMEQEPLEEQLWSKQRDLLVKMLETHFAALDGIQFLEFNPITGDVSLRINTNDGSFCKRIPREFAFANTSRARLSGIAVSRESEEFTIMRSPSEDSVAKQHRQMYYGQDVGKRRFDRAATLAPAHAIGAVILQTILYRTLLASNSDEVFGVPSSFMSSVFGDISNQNQEYLDELVSFVYLEPLLETVRSDDAFTGMEDLIVPFIRHAFDTAEPDTPINAPTGVCGGCGGQGGATVTLLPCRHFDCCAACISKLISKNCSKCDGVFESFIEIRPSLLGVPLVEPYSDILVSLGLPRTTRPSKFMVDSDPPLHFAWNMVNGIVDVVSEVPSPPSFAPRWPYTRVLPSHAVSELFSGDGARGSGMKNLFFAHRMSSLIFETEEIIRVRRNRTQFSSWIRTAAATASSLIPRKVSVFSESSADGSLIVRDLSQPICRDSITFGRLAKKGAEDAVTKKIIQDRRSTFEAHEIGHADDTISIYENKLVLLHHLLFGEVPAERTSQFLELQTVLKLRHWGLESESGQTIFGCEKWTHRARGLTYRSGMQVAQWVRATSVLYSLRKNLSKVIHVGLVGFCDLELRAVAAAACCPGSSEDFTRNAATGFGVLHGLMNFSPDCGLTDGNPLGNVLFVSFPPKDDELWDWGCSLVNVAVIVLLEGQSLEPISKLLAQIIPVLVLVNPGFNRSKLADSFKRQFSSGRLFAASTDDLDAAGAWIKDRVGSLLNVATDDEISQKLGDTRIRDTLTLTPDQTPKKRGRLFIERELSFESARLDRASTTTTASSPRGDSRWSGDSATRSKWTGECGVISDQQSQTNFLLSHVKR